MREGGRGTAQSVSASHWRERLLATTEMERARSLLTWREPPPGYPPPLPGFPYTAPWRETEDAGRTGRERGGWGEKEKERERRQ